MISAGSLGKKAFMEHWSSGDIKIPKLGFGTWLLRGGEAVFAVKKALEAGLRLIDTAQIYKNEREVGEAIRESHVQREDVFLTTKIWRDSLSPELVKKTAGESLERLQTDYIDLLLIHWPHPQFPLAETLAAFEELKKENKIRFIGVSNFPLALMREAKKLCPSVITNQVEYHPFLSQEALLSSAERSGMFLTAYSPLMRGKITKSRQLMDIGARHKKTAAQVALRWIVEQKNAAALFRSSKEERIRENANIFDFQLSASDRSKLFRLTQNNQRTVSPPFAPAWDN